MNTMDGLREGLGTLGILAITLKGNLEALVYGLEKVMVCGPVYADEKKVIEKTNCAISTNQQD